MPDRLIPICSSCHVQVDEQESSTFCTDCRKRARVPAIFLRVLLRLTKHPDKTLARLATGLVNRLALYSPE